MHLLIHIRYSILITLSLYFFSGITNSQDIGCEDSFVAMPHPTCQDFRAGHSVAAGKDYIAASYSGGVRLYNSNLGYLGHLNSSLTGIGCVSIHENVIAKGNGSLVRIHRNNGFEQEINLNSPSDSLDEKRKSIAIGKNYLAVGLTAFNNNSGGVEVWKFDGNTWLFSEIIQAPGSDIGNGEQYFGYSVDAFGDYLAIGAPNYFFDSASGQFSGAVYLYKLIGDNFVLQNTLLPNTVVTPPSALGTAVSIHENIVVAGAHNHGLVYSWTFDGNAWVEQPVLSSGGTFGYALDTDGQRLIVSHQNGPGGVVVYSYTTSGWVEKGTLSASGGGSSFGGSIALLGDSAVIGHPDVNTDIGGFSYSCDITLEGIVHLYNLFDHSLRPEDLIVNTPPDPIQGWSLDQFMTLSTCTEVYGFSYGLQHTDPTHVSVSAVDLAGTVSESIGAEYLAVEIDNANGLYTVGCVLDLTPPLDKFFDSGVNQKIIRAQLSVDPLIPLQSGPEVRFDIVSGQGTPPVDLYLTIPGPIDTIPEVSQSSLDLPEIPRFIRGDINASGFRNVTDAVFLLFYLFGEPVDLVCASAADVNDDSAIDLADPVYLLDSLYLSTAPAIPVPSAACGIDPTVDALTCESSICP